MRRSLYRHIALATVLAGPVAAHAQTAAAQPAVSVASDQIYIANSTNQELVFFVESENTQRTEYRLAPGAAGMLHGEPGDKWLNIEMQSDGAAGGTGDQAGASR